MGPVVAPIFRPCIGSHCIGMGGPAVRHIPDLVNLALALLGLASLDGGRPDSKAASWRRYARRGIVHLSLHVSFKRSCLRCGCWRGLSRWRPLWSDFSRRDPPMAAICSAEVACGSVTGRSAMRRRRAAEAPGFTHSKRGPHRPTHSSPCLPIPIPIAIPGSSPHYRSPCFAIATLARRHLQPPPKFRRDFCVQTVLTSALISAGAAGLRLLCLAGFTLLLGGAGPAMASTTPNSAKDGGVQAVFATQQEAEAAAPRFGCTGSHRHGSIWMPCTSHPPAGGSQKGGQQSGGQHGGHSH